MSTKLGLGRDIASDSLFEVLLRDLLPREIWTDDLGSRPRLALRNLFDYWVQRGGFERGKHRHSARQIRDWLGPEREIRSLAPKLAGKTRLQRDDARNLLLLMLEKWNFHEETRSCEPFDWDSLDDQIDDILNEIYPDSLSGILLTDEREEFRRVRSVAAPDRRSSVQQDFLVH